MGQPKLYFKKSLFFFKKFLQLKTKTKELEEVFPKQVIFIDINKQNGRIIIQRRAGKFYFQL